MASNKNGPLRVGIGGPVGSGKTSLMEALCKSFRGHLSNEDAALIAQSLNHPALAQVVAAH